MTGVPCKHAITAIYMAKEFPEDYVSEFFKKPSGASYLQCQDHMIGSNRYGRHRTSFLSNQTWEEKEKEKAKCR